MKQNTYKKTVEEILAHAGVKVDGTNPWDIQVHNEALYQRVLSKGSLGLGEAYMDGWWDSPALDQFFFKILQANLEEKVATWDTVVQAVKARLFNYQTKSEAFEIGEKHYDIGNDLYDRMLDRRLTYTCGYWKDAQTLDAAQEAKLDLVCRKIGLKPGMTVLDIGCGWGSFMKYAAEKYGVTCVGVTVSKEQIALGEKLCAGLPVEFRLLDYRDIPQEFPKGFDRIVSIGMFEHVGKKNYTEFFKVVEKSLAENGLFLLHTIGTNAKRMAVDPWIEKYIFPKGMVPGLEQVSRVFEEHFVMEDLHNFGAYYDLTLMEWFKNFDRAWPDIGSAYSERFYRMWKYYLLSCAGSFRARKIQLWQMVFSKKGVAGGYESVR